VRTRQRETVARVCCRKMPRLAASASVEHSTRSTMSLITWQANAEKVRQRSPEGES